MEVTRDLSFVHLIMDASVLVQLVMGLLLFGIAIYAAQLKKRKDSGDAR